MYERDGLRKHMKIAKSLVQLVEDPDKEVPEVKDKGDVLVKGLETVREIRAAEAAAIKAAELERR